MHPDTRITIYGGSVTSLSLVGLGLFTSPVITYTGVTLAGGTLVLVSLLEALLGE